MDGEVHGPQLGENARGFGHERVVRLQPEQDERIACGAVQRAEATVVVVLPPQPVLISPSAEHLRRLARRCPHEAHSGTTRAYDMAGAATRTDVTLVALLPTVPRSR